jgi:hypothetical protein
MKGIFLVAAIVLLTLPVAVQAQHVKVHYDRSADFSKFKTYSWIKGLDANDPEVHRLIVEDIHSQLQSRGLQEVEQGGDLNITYYSSLAGNINTHAVEYMKGVDWKQWGEHDEVYGPKMVEMPIAKMVVDIVDASANRLIWRGSASDAYTPNEARGKKRVNSSVAKMFEKFPPPPKK